MHHTHRRKTATIADNMSVPAFEELFRPYSQIGAPATRVRIHAYKRGYASVHETAWLCRQDWSEKMADALIASVRLAFGLDNSWTVRIHAHA